MNKSLYYIYIFTCLVFIMACKESNNTTSTNESDPIQSTNFNSSQEDTSPPFFITAKKAYDTKVGLHSFEVAQTHQSYLIVGGRTNGFHGTSGEGSTFPVSQANDSIFYFDPNAKLMKSVALPSQYKDHLSSTNMSAAQVGDYLYCLGGYGSSCATGDTTDACYQTYPYLTILNAFNIADDIKNDKPLDPSDFVQISNENFRVAGGELMYIDDLFYIVFGQNYKGKYKPGRNGAYTEEIRTFKLDNMESPNPIVTDYSAIKDPTGKTGTDSEFHRRDLNVVSVIRGDGTAGIDVYGGVFNAEDLAYLHPISINGMQTTVHSNKLTMGLYDCAKVQVYLNNATHIWLLGGIGGYYYENEKLVKDDLPFNKAITLNVHNSDDSITEYVQPYDQQLPDYLGANAFFFPNTDQARTSQSNDIIDGNDLLQTGTYNIGRMYGGILASGTQTGRSGGSYANTFVYDISLHVK